MSTIITRANDDLTEQPKHFQNNYYLSENNLQIKSQGVSYNFSRAKVGFGVKLLDSNKRTFVCLSTNNIKQYLGVSEQYLNSNSYLLEKNIRDVTHLIFKQLHAIASKSLQDILGKKLLVLDYLDDEKQCKKPVSPGECTIHYIKELGIYSLHYFTRNGEVKRKNFGIDSHADIYALKKMHFNGMRDDILFDSPEEFVKWVKAKLSKHKSFNFKNIKKLTLFNKELNKKNAAKIFTASKCSVQFGPSRTANSFYIWIKDLDSKLSSFKFKLENNCFNHPILNRPPISNWRELQSIVLDLTVNCIGTSDLQTGIEGIKNEQSSGVIIPHEDYYELINKVNESVASYVVSFNLHKGTFGRRQLPGIYVENNKDFTNFYKVGNVYLKNIGSSKALSGRIQNPLLNKGKVCFSEKSLKPQDINSYKLQEFYNYRTQIESIISIWREGDVESLDIPLLRQQKINVLKHETEDTFYYLTDEKITTLFTSKNGVLFAFFRPYKKVTQQEGISMPSSPRGY